MATAMKPVAPASVKTLAEVRADMSELYEQVKEGSVDLRVAAELANITGKYLKATQLEFAREVFLKTYSGRFLPGSAE